MFSASANASAAGPNEQAVGRWLLDRPSDGIEAFRQELAHFVEQRARLHQENAAVPEEAAALRHIRRPSLRSASREAGDRKCAVSRRCCSAFGFDVAILGVRLGRLAPKVTIAPSSACGTPVRPRRGMRRGRRSHGPTASAASARRCPLARATRRRAPPPPTCLRATGSSRIASTGAPQPGAGV